MCLKSKTWESTKDRIRLKNRTYLASQKLRSNKKFSVFCWCSHPTLLHIAMCQVRSKDWASRMAGRVKVPAANPHDLSPIPWTLKSQTLSSALHMCVDTHTPTHRYSQSKCVIKSSNWPSQNAFSKKETRLLTQVTILIHTRVKASVS